MWLIGIVALCQVVYLPGAVLLRLLRVAGLNPFEQIAGVFAASLMTNCILVTILGSLGLHVPVVWWILILAEVAYLIWSRREKYPPWRFDFSWLRELRTIRATTAVAGIAFFAILGIYVVFLVNNWGSVYVANDDVANWDRWAIEWSQNILPTHTTFYPQLLSTNGSISYVLLGMSDVKMFSKAVAPVYTVLALLLFLSLAIRRRNHVYLAGGAAFGFLVIHYMGTIFPTYGYADLPLAFFGFLTFYCVYRSEVPSRNEVIAGLVASLGALLTKQGAVYVLAAMIVYAVYWYLEQKKLARTEGIPAAPFFKKDAAILWLAIFGAFTAIWYAGKYIQIIQGGDFSNLNLLTQGLHQGRSYPMRLVAAAYMFFKFRSYTGPVVTVLIALLFVASLFVRRTRPLTLYVLTPFLLLYGFFFSYEIRNALLAFPLAGLICAETVYALAAFIPKPERTWKFVPGGVIGAAAVTALITGWLVSGEPGRNALPDFVIRALTDPWIAAASHLFGLSALIAALVTLAIILVVRIDSGEIEVGRLFTVAIVIFVILGASSNSGAALIESQKRVARNTIGDPDVNDHLYAVIAQRKITAGIVTDYWYLRALPEIKTLFRRTGCGAPCTPRGLRASVIAYPDAKYVLMSDRNLDPATIRMMDAGTGFKTVFDLNYQRLIEVDRVEMDRRPEAIGAPAVGYMDQGDQGILVTGTRNAPIPVSGWEACADPASPLQTIEVLVDNKVVARTAPSSMRPDVAHVFGRPDFEFSGWKTTFSGADLTLGMHALTARGTCKKGESGTTVPFKLNITP